MAIGIEPTLSGKLLKNKAEQSAAIITSEEVTAVDLALLKFFIDKRQYSGIILCVDRPSTFYLEMLTENGMKTSGIYFIDVGFPGEASESVSKVGEGPSDLTFMKIEITRVAQRMRAKDAAGGIFFLNDCLSTLLQYNEEKQVGRFLHELSGKLRELKVYSLVLLEPGEGGISLVAKRSCDKIVKLD